MHFITTVKISKATNIITVFLILILVLPTVIQLNHSLEKHTEFSSKKAGFNQAFKNKSCTVFHDLFLIKSTLDFTSAKIISLFFYKETNFQTPYLKVLPFLFSITVRGPPSLII